MISSSAVLRPASTRGPSVGGFFGVLVALMRQRDSLQRENARLRRAKSLEPRVKEIISRLDPQGRWVTGNMLHISTFVSNMNALCEYLECVAPPKSR